MIRWSPATELANLHGAMDRLFEDFFSPPAAGNRSERALTPLYALPLDVREVEGGYEITAPVPGFKPEEVEVTFQDGVLKVVAQHSAQTAERQEGFIRREVAWGNYGRTIMLPGDIKEDGITASFEDGMLTVTVPKAPRPQPRRIEVGAGAGGTKAAKPVLAGKN